MQYLAKKKVFVDNLKRIFFRKEDLIDERKKTNKKPHSDYI